MSQSPQDAFGYQCPSCNASLVTNPAKVGTRRKCPACHKTIKIPASASTPENQKSDSLAVSGYQLADQNKLSVVCTYCEKVLFAKIDQIGEELICPDCLESVVVTAPPDFASPTASNKTPEKTAETTAAEDDPTEDDDSLRLSDPIERPVSSSLTDDLVPNAAPTAHAAEDEDNFEFSIPCPLCGSRVYARISEVDETKKCPDCHSEVTITPPPKKILRSERHLDKDIEDFGLGAPEVQHDDVRTASSRQVKTEAQDALARAEAAVREAEEVERQTTVVIPKTLPFFLFSAQALPRWILLSVMIGLAGSLAQFTFFAPASQPSMQFLKLFSSIGMFLLATPAFITLFANCLAIFGDTANGDAEITSWPDTNFTEWMTDSLYIINALVISGLPPAAVAQLFICAGIKPLGVLVWFAGTLGLFPLVFVSFLDQDSMILPFSKRVWTNLSQEQPTWLVFYLISGALGLLGVLIFFSFTAESVVLHLAAGLLLVGITMLYFRVLGWCIWNCRESLVLSDFSDDDDADDNDRADDDAELPTKSD